MKRKPGATNPNPPKPNPLPPPNAPTGAPPFPPGTPGNPNPPVPAVKHSSWKESLERMSDSDRRAFEEARSEDEEIVSIGPQAIVTTTIPNGW